MLLEYRHLFVCLCLYHCWCSLSTLRCDAEKAIHTTNETVSAEHINLSVGSACHNALCSTNNAHMAADRQLRTVNISGMIASDTSAIAESANDKR